MEDYQKFRAPIPVVNQKEAASLDALTERYNKLIAPSRVAKIGMKVGELIPEKVKLLGGELAETISAQDLYKQSMEWVANGFKVIEEHAAKFLISEKTIIKKVNSVVPEYEITDLSEICFARSYKLSKVVNKYKGQDTLAAFVEGGITGAAGFWGLPFNFVLSTFLYFRAVQSIAMFYGYDVKNDSY